MKNTFTLMITIIFLVCAKQGYELLMANNECGGHPTGSLSDISDEVIAIPLRNTGTYSIKEARFVRRQGKDLFLVSGESLFRFSRDGELICRISDPKMIKVAGYVVNPVSRQLIVLGNDNDIFYYNYEGELLARKKRVSDLPNHRFLSISMLNNRIFTTEECIPENSASSPTPPIEKQVIEYDSTFRKIKSYKLAQADLQRSTCPIGSIAPQIGMAQNSGILYAYEPSRQPEHLLRDTLYLHQKYQNEELAELSAPNTLPILPIRIGSRFWISTYHQAENESKNYTFCYDTHNHRSWHIEGGLKDDFYHTGAVKGLEAMDPFCHSYSFSRQGKELMDSFPEVGSDHLVLFIVRLKA